MPDFSYEGKSLFRFGYFYFESSIEMKQNEFVQINKGIQCKFDVRQYKRTHASIKAKRCIILTFHDIISNCFNYYPFQFDFKFLLGYKLG